METLLFGVVPVLAFVGLAARSALRGRAGSVRTHEPEHDPIDPIRGGR